MFDNRKDLADGLNAIREALPTAVEVTLTSSDQDHYGFVVTGIQLADETTLSYDSFGQAGDPEAWLKLMDKVEPFFLNLTWNSVVGEDKHGDADVDIPDWTVAVTPFGENVSTYTAYGDEAEARSQYAAAAEAGDARVRLYRGAAGSQAPISDTAVLIRLDEDDKVEDVFENLHEAIVRAGFGPDDEVSYNVPTGVRNAIRAYRLREALLGYDLDMGRGQTSNEHFETVLKDFLNDLHHVCNLLGVPLSSYVERAEISYTEEVQGEL